MTHSDTLAKDIETGTGIAEEALQFREEHRWRTQRDDPSRQSHLEQLIDSIDDAMKALKPHIGRQRWEPLPPDLSEALGRASARLQYERRQLKKMRPV